MNYKDLVDQLTKHWPGTYLDGEVICLPPCWGDHLDVSVAPEGTYYSVVANTNVHPFVEASVLIVNLDEVKDWITIVANAAEEMFDG